MRNKRASCCQCSSSSTHRPLSHSHARPLEAFVSSPSQWAVGCCMPSPNATEPLATHHLKALSPVSLSQALTWCRVASDWRNAFFSAHYCIVWLAGPMIVTNDEQSKKKKLKKERKSTQRQLLSCNYFIIYHQVTPVQEKLGLCHTSLHLLLKANTGPLGTHPGLPGLEIFVCSWGSWGYLGQLWVFSLRKGPEIRV